MLCINIYIYSRFVCHGELERELRVDYRRRENDTTTVTAAAAKGRATAVKPGRRRARVRIAVADGANRGRGQRRRRKVGGGERGGGGSVRKNGDGAAKQDRYCPSPGDAVQKLHTAPHARNTVV